MTRINLVPPSELSNQHLLAEWRELPRMKAYAEKATNTDIPKQFTLNTGHMRFFLNKASWLEHRHSLLTQECLNRKININRLEKFIASRRFGDVVYEPSIEEINISRLRIYEKLAAKPQFYRWTLTS